MIYNLEYEVLSDIDTPSHLKEVGYKTSATVFLFETNEKNERISLIGTYNFKIKNKKKMHDEIIPKIQRIIFIRHEQKENLDKIFQEIISKF